jgi:hypothetical protein
VASNGLIEKVRTNSILQSEAFNTTWVPASVSVTPNTTANPLNGALTADTITLTGATAPKYITQPIIYGGSTTTSVYLKAGTHQFVQICLGTDPAPSANFDLVNGTASATNSTASIVSVGGGFFRCSMAATSIIGTDIIIIAVDSLAAARFASTASTGTFIAFGAQVETGDIATAYIATTTAAVSVGPVSGLPRLDYLGSTCPRLILEPQRSSLMLYSEQMNNAVWTKRNSTISANAAISPDGYTNADKIQEDTSNDRHDIYQDFSATSGTTYTNSIFLKQGERRYAFISFGSGLIDPNNSFFDLQDGVVLATPAGVTSTITNYGNGWYRCTITATASGSGTAYLVTGASLNGTSISYQGVSGSGIFTYGAQLEVGAYATSYIPTLGASVTRVADAATTASVPSLIGQTEGTMFIEFNRTNTFEAAFFMLSNLVGTTTNAYQNSFYFLQQANGTMVVEVYVASAAQVLFTVAALSVGTHKMALAYKANDFALYVDGVQLGTDTSGSVPTANFLSIGGAVDGGAQKQSVSQALLFKTRLTNAQLAELTA